MDMCPAAVLVPLDRSGSAETILAPAASLVQALGGRITLLHIIPPATSLIAVGEPAIGQPGAPERHEAELRAGAERYLRSIARHLEACGIVTDCVVRAAADVGAAILDEAERLPATVIALAPHDVPGQPRWARGSTVEQVLHAAPVPVLLNSSEAQPRAALGSPLRRILVPITGQPHEEQAVDAARTLGARAGARLLLAAILPAGTTAAAAWSAPPPPQISALTAAAATLRAADIAIETTVRVGDLASTLRHLSNDYRINLVILCSTAYAGRPWRSQPRAGEAAQHAALLLLPTPHEEHTRPIAVALRRD